MAIEYLRPTADANSTSGPITGGSNVVAPSCSAVYTGKSGAGPITSPSVTWSSGTVTVSEYSARNFTNFQSPTKTYTDLTINITLLGIQSGNDSGAYGAYLSMNGGVTWNKIIFLQDVGYQQTWQVDITGAVVSSVIVEAGWETVAPNSMNYGINIYDIWLEGTYTGPISSPNYAIDDYGQVISFGRWR